MRTSAILTLLLLSLLAPFAATVPRIASSTASMALSLEGKLGP